MGSTVNFCDRYRRHRKDLRGEKHHCLPLQRAFNKYGETNFSFEILETCEKNELMTREQYYLDSIDNLYNVYIFSGSPRKSKRSEIANLKTHLSTTTSGFRWVSKKSSDNCWAIYKGRMYIGSHPDPALANRALSLINLGMSRKRVQIWLKAHKPLASTGNRLYTGVREFTTHHREKPFSARVFIDHKEISLGSYTSPEEAAQARYYFMMDTVYGDYDE